MKNFPVGKDPNEFECLVLVVEVEVGLVVGLEVEVGLVVGEVGWWRWWVSNDRARLRVEMSLWFCIHENVNDVNG